MEIILRFLIAMFPPLILIFYMYKRDKFKKEPCLEIVKGFALGLLSCFIVIPIERTVDTLIAYLSYSSPVSVSILEAFGGAAIPEESVKLLMLWLLLRKCKYFDEYVDGIVYAVSIGMGFAFLENIKYILGVEDWVVTGIGRAFLAVPGHFSFAVVMGYFYSLAHYDKANKWQKTCTLLLPILLHGIYDSLAFISDLPIWGGTLIFLLLIIFCIFIYREASKRIEAHLRTDKQENLRNILDKLS